MGLPMRLVAVTLPELGTSAGCTIVVSHWYTAAGREVLEGERLVELLVGPATFDVPAPATGRLVEICEDEDNFVPSGAILGWVSASDEETSADVGAEF